MSFEEDIDILIFLGMVESSVVINCKFDVSSRIFLRHLFVYLCCEWTVFRDQIFLVIFGSNLLLLLLLLLFLLFYCSTTNLELTVWNRLASNLEKFSYFSLKSTRITAWTTCTQLQTKTFIVGVYYAQTNVLLVRKGFHWVLQKPFVCNQCRVLAFRKLSRETVVYLQDGRLQWGATNIPILDYLASFFCFHCFLFVCLFQLDIS